MKAWLRALELTAPITGSPGRTLPVVIDELAEKVGDAPALLSERECMTYGVLADRSNRYARWALDQGLAKGEPVCLLMPNRPEYMAVWLGITKVGGVVALLNTNLTGPSLAHCVNIVAPRHLIVDAELLEPLIAAVPDLAGASRIWVHGSTRTHGLPRIDRQIERITGEKLHDTERRPVTIQDRALQIYTSGTTGRSKAANINHYHLMQASHWFAGIMDVRSNDRMYDCLPMYHIVGGVQTTGAVLVGGGSVVIREKFSAREFWNDITRWNCTLFQYIGELCRYLLRVERCREETEHRIRTCCGNGLRPDIWNEFKTRFRIPQILEFYGATEGIVSLFNVEGKPGAIGRIPPYLANRFPATLVKFDVETEQPVRDERGFCVRSAANEIGEAIGKVSTDPSKLGARFEGYSNEEASQQKILRNVFEPGDTWFRTGDLMRKDANGYFYFVDRIGDTLRWKGENVATSEVSDAVRAFPGILEASAYGVAISGSDGRACMVALVIDKELDLAALRTHLMQRLPAFARPLFLRIRGDLETTATFKYAKTDLMREGYDPANTSDVIYFNDPERNAFVRMDQELFERIQTGNIRL